MYLALCILLLITITARSQAFSLDNTDPRPLCPCGGSDSLLDPRIIGGYDAGPGEFPYAIGIAYARFEKFKPAIVWCGATLITESYAVTAAHCLENVTSTKDIMVNVGAHDFHEPSHEDTRKVKSFIMHPDYISKYLHNDIALIELDEPAQWESGIKTAVLPQPDLQLRPQDVVTVFGWGYVNSTTHNASILQTIQLPLVENYDCKGRTGFEILPSMFCAGGIAGEDSCRGDSGSGTVVRLGNEYVLCGLVSFGFECALADLPAIYTRVSSYTDWILKETSSSQCRPCVYDDAYPRTY